MRDSLIDRVAGAFDFATVVDEDDLVVDGIRRQRRTLVFVSALLICHVSDCSHAQLVDHWDWRALLMTAELPDVRRIVTGHTPSGEATIVEDGPAPSKIRNPARPGFVLRNIWRTGETPATVDAPDSIAEQQGLLPPAGGTILRVIDFPPEPTDPELLRQQVEAAFKAQYPDAEHTGSDREQPHPGMHKTATVDYAIVLHGTIVAILDDCETEMQAGDVLVQRGTNHAWSNRSDNPARIAFVLVDGVAGPAD